MSMTRWDPFGLESLQQNIDRLFKEHMGGTRRETPASARTWAPPVDVIEDESQIIVKAELPGLKKEDIDIELTGDTLTIKGERRFEDQEKRDSFVRVERSYGQFQRAFTIGIPVDATKVKASYKDGILEVTIPKAEEVKPKKVEVGVD